MSRMHHIKRRVAVLVAVLSLGFVGLGSAYAATTVLSSNPAVAKASNLYGCVGPNRAISGVYTVASNFKGCPKGEFAISVVSGSAGPQGPAGPSGTVTPVTASATTSISDDSDSGNNGPWATDTLTRSMTITRHGAAAVADCGGDSTNGVASCWYYTASMTDTGSFITVAGAKSPQAGVDIAGTLAGSISGGSDFEFYASSGTPSAADVPGVLDASVNGTDSSLWPERFFGAGTVFGDVNEIDWVYTYTTPSTCEKWVDAFNNSDGSLTADGDITGVNACQQ